MPRTNIPIQTTTRVAASANIVWTAADGPNDHEFDNSSEKVILLMKNTNGTTHDVVIKRPAIIDGTPIGDLTFTVPQTTGLMVVGPFPKGIYNQTGDKVYVDTPAAPTNLSFGLLKLGSL